MPRSLRVALPLPVVLLAVAAPAAHAAAGWPLAVAQPHGATLRTAAVGGAPSAATGFADAQGWHGATAVASAGRGTATLAVAGSDRRLRVVAGAPRGGVAAIRVTVTGTGPAATRVGLGFAAPRGERYFGFGERANALDQRGHDVEDDVADGPFSPESRDVVQATIPPAGFRDREDATYYPVPWLLSGRGYGVLVDDDERSVFALPEDGGTWGVQVDAPSLRLRVFAGPTPAAALGRFTRATGRQPKPSSTFSFGP